MYKNLPWIQRYNWSFAAITWYSFLNSEATLRQVWQEHMPENVALLSDILWHVYSGFCGAPVRPNMLIVPKSTCDESACIDDVSKRLLLLIVLHSMQQNFMRFCDSICLTTRSTTRSHTSGYLNARALYYCVDYCSFAGHSPLTRRVGGIFAASGARATQVTPFITASI